MESHRVGHLTNMTYDTAAAPFGWAAGPLPWGLAHAEGKPRGFGATERAARVRLLGSFPARCGQLRRRAECTILIDAIPPARFEKTVESRRGALVEGGGNSCFRRPSPSCWCLVLHLDRVSSPCASNPACGFPTRGSHLRSCLRSLEAPLPQLEAFQAHSPATASHPGTACIVAGTRK